MQPIRGGRCREREAPKAATSFRRSRPTQVAFALLSSGIFRGRQSLRGVLDVAVTAVARSAYPGLARVHLVAFTRREQDALLAAAAARFD